jgi:imidazolonepropionase-like amidohydrolase
MTIRALAFPFALAVLPGAAVLGQSRQIPAAAQSNPVIITSATVHTVTGPTIDDGYVVFDNGVILDVGQGRPPDVRNAEVVTANGLHVYPGLVSTDTTLGLIETSAVDVTHDYAELGDITPEVRAAVAVNPDSELIPVARANGILTAAVFPRGGLVAGRGSIIRLDGWTWEQMTIVPAAGLVISWPRTEPDMRETWRRPKPKPAKEQREAIEKNLRRIDTLFDDAAVYLKAVGADPAQKTDLRFEALRDVLAGRTPIFARASTQGQIESAVVWANRRGLKMVIVGGREAGKAAALLREYDVPVIIGGLHSLPGHRDDPYDEPFTLPARLYDAGVRFTIASGTGAAHERNLNHNAATAVAFGLAPDQALKAITADAATILGIGDTHGAIEVGKAATLIVTTGDPLQITTDTLIAWIDGRQIDLGNRHKALYDKYREKYRQLGLLEGD